jgi:hypothetical protein
MLKPEERAQKPILEARAPLIYIAKVTYMIETQQTPREQGHAERGPLGVLKSFYFSKEDISFKNLKEVPNLKNFLDSTVVPGLPLQQSPDDVNIVSTF